MGASACPWVGHLVSRLSRPTDVALFRLGFPAAPPLKGLTRAGHDNSPDHYAKGTRSRESEDYAAPTARRHGVSGSVSSPDRGSSHRSVALLGSLSVVIECLALGEGPPRFRPGFTCPTLLGYRIGPLALSPTGLSPAPAPLSSGLRLTLMDPTAPAPRPRMVTHSV